MGIPFPDIDPVLIQIGPFAVRWYALAYIAGLLFGWRYIIRLAGTGTLWVKKNTPLTREQADDFLLWATLGVIMGGRLGYVLFYKPAYYFSHPMEIFAVWQGGMSFHGGFLGVITAIILFSRQARVPVWSLGDLVALAAPIGYFFGRLANFINGELWGRVSDVPWAMVFPAAGPDLRHPSQLYQAFLGGICLFFVLRWLALHTGMLKNTPGAIVGCFFTGYGAARIAGEFFRQPDAHIGFVGSFLTTGMILSLPMLLIGGVILYGARADILPGLEKRNP